MDGGDRTRAVITSAFGVPGENDRIAKRVYVGEHAGTHSVGRLQKRWIDTVNVCLKKRALDVRQARRMVHQRSEWRGFLRGNACSQAQNLRA